MSVECYAEHRQRFRAKPVMVFNGNSLAVTPDDSTVIGIRIADLNTPGLLDPGGEEARKRLADVVGWQNGPVLRIATRERIGDRFLADVYVIGGNGDLVNVRELLR